MGKNMKKKPVSEKPRWLLKAVFGICRLFRWFFEGLRKPMKRLWPVLDFREFERTKRTQFYLNIVAGLLIVLLMYVVESTQWGEGALNGAFDRFIRMEAKKAVKADADMGDISLVDIGHNTNRERDFNYLSPRDTIARLLKMAVDGGAKIIVLDFFFEENDCCHPKRDDTLRGVLSNNNTRTKVIFPVNVYDGAARPLIFDPEIDNNPNYFRAIPDFYASSTDSIGRYWKAFREYGNKKILWSIPVLTAALHEGKTDALKEIENKIREGKKSGIYAVEMNRENNKKFLLPIGDDDVYLQRIRYRLIPKDCIPAYPEGNTRLPTIKNLTGGRFKDKIVIIGNSNPNVGDVHSTPVGNMPGMFIHGNSVNTLLQGLQPGRAPWWVSILMNIFIIIPAAYLFHYLDSFLADLLGMVGSIIILGAIAYFYFFRIFGIFPNFAFGIAGIGYIETMYSLREFFSKRKGETEDKEVGDEG